MDLTAENLTCEKFYLKTLETEIREEAAVPKWLMAMVMELMGVWMPLVLGVVLSPHYVALA